VREEFVNGVYRRAKLFFFIKIMVARLKIQLRLVNFTIANELLQIPRIFSKIKYFCAPSVFRH